MPMGPLAELWQDRYVPASTMRRRLEPIVDRWDAIEQGHDSAYRFRLTLDDQTYVTVGFITPMSCHFCAA